MCRWQSYNEVELTILSIFYNVACRGYHPENQNAFVEWSALGSSLPVSCYAYLRMLFFQGQPKFKILSDKPVGKNFPFFKLSVSSFFKLHIFKADKFQII